MKERKPITRQLPPTPPPVILYEDNHLLVVRKPAGMLSQGDPTGDLSLVDWAAHDLKQRFGKPGNVFVGLIHRLDRPVGGVMVLARTSKAALRLTQQFQAHTVQKTYWALTERLPREPEGTLTHHLRKKIGLNVIRAYDEPVTGSKPAVLHYRQLATSGTRALIEVRPITGRQHQIRVQLTRIGCPIVGDGKYGKTEFLPDLTIGLFGHRLSFEHPISRERMAFESQPPDRFPWNLFPDRVAKAVE